jgi:hypothetical protein
MIDTLLETGNGQQVLLDTIQQLSEERYALRVRLATHPQSDHAVALRIHKINSQLRVLWAEVRRVRASRRSQMEEALGVDPRLVIL